MAKKKKSVKSCEYGRVTRGPRKGLCRKNKPRKPAKKPAKKKASKSRKKASVRQPIPVSQGSRRANSGAWNGA